MTDDFKLTMTHISDNEDGSATVNLDMDANAVRCLINYGFVAMLRDAIASKKLLIEDEMKAGGTE
jgi:hypothetical protein